MSKQQNLDGESIEEGKHHNQGEARDQKRDSARVEKPFPPVFRIIPPKRREEFIKFLYGLSVPNRSLPGCLEQAKAEDCVKNETDAPP